MKIILLIALIAIAVVNTTINKVDHNTILDSIKSQGPKTLFKAWHFLMNKSYDYNTEEGIRRYQIFKRKLVDIEEHNKKGLSWKKGLNHLSDMTFEEINAYYNIKPLNPKMIVKNFRSLGSVSLDDYNDDGEKVSTPKKNKSVGVHTEFDWTSSMQPIRNQGNCGSCWAFATMAVIEGSRQKWSGGVSGHYSTQQLVDCDTGNGGCDGGWYNNAFDYFKQKNIVTDIGYPYKAARAATCGYTDGMSGDTGLKLTGLNYHYMDYGNANFDDILAKGPCATAVFVNQDWYDYSSGVFSGGCTGQINHAVVIIGFSNADGGYFKIRNSWGTGWGEQGHIRLRNDASNKSCLIEDFCYAPIGFSGTPNPSPPPPSPPSPVPPPPAPETNCAQLFEGRDYTGNSITVCDNIPCLSLLTWGKRLSSIKVASGTKARLYSGDGYSGNSLTLSGQFGNFDAYNFDDVTMSVMINPPTTKCVTLYQFAKFQGNSVVICNNTPQFDATWNDKVNSAQVSAGVTAVFFENANYGGRALAVRVQNQDFVNSGMSNKASSVLLI